ncbi:coth protein-domain-containing protein [Fennellomyces sp. T-0311]|nr:coth protein-domain-containing protein [Fennellomyces sp. T-0311]
MVVIVDDNSYKLAQSPACKLVYTGIGPAAQQEYYYAKMDPTGAIIERELLSRRPSYADQTPYEFYNRTDNNWIVSDLPQIYESEFHRIHTELHKDGEIGTIYITGNQSEIDIMHANTFGDNKVVTNTTFIRGNELLTFPNTKFELAGRGSRIMTKLSYNLKIPKGGDTLYGYRKLKLRALAYDPSYIREMLVYKMLKSAGVATTEFSYVRVFINDQAVGLFGLVEKFQGPWLKNEFAYGDNDYQQGNLYLGMATDNTSKPFDRPSDLSYYGDNVTLYADGQYKIKEDPSDMDPSLVPLINLTKFIANSPTDADVAFEEWNQHFNMNSVLRSLALEVNMGFSDGYLAAAENYYLYQDGLNSNRFIFIPSDVDWSLGSTMAKLADMLTGNYSTFPGLHLRPLVNQLLRIPVFKQEFEELLQLFARELVNPDVVNPFIDSLVAQISSDVEWDHTLPRLSKFDLNSNLNGPNPIIDDRIYKYPFDKDTMKDVESHGPIPFMTAINGNTGSISCTGVKEFIANSSRAILAFYDRQ